MRYFVLNKEGFVVNLIIWDGVSKINWIDETLILESECPHDVRMGWQKVDGGWTPPVIEPTEEATE